MALSLAGPPSGVRAGAPEPVPVRAAPQILVSEARLTAPDAVTGDGFGFSVAMSGETLVVGTPQDANPGDRGNLRLYPAELGPPLASAINFVAGATRANNAVLELGPGGPIKVQCDMLPGSTSTTHFVLDVFGYFR